MTARRRCTGAILAGGRATRMGGTPKGLATVGGRRIIDRVASALADAADELLVVSNDASADAWLAGVRAVADVRPGAGALSGLHAALHHAGTDLMVVAWDAPFTSTALLDALRDAGEFEDAGAAVPRSAARSGFEPLCAWYAASCLDPVTRAIDEGRFHAGGWQRAVRLLELDPSPFGDPATIFFNVNTPDDLVRAERLA
ncbi:MAG: molybdenum cofactor guanylyltransferase [Gemmatimonadetes bacterium]|nr:molybdenum cofactor guanylyltransferase [Gemmatimonadota bacterium]